MKSFRNFLTEEPQVWWAQIKIDASMPIPQEVMIPAVNYFNAKRMLEAQFGKGSILYGPFLKMTENIEPKVGMKFAHARVLNSDKSPMTYEVTRIVKGAVFYKPIDGGHSEYTDIGKFHKIVKHKIDETWKTFDKLRLGQKFKRGGQLWTKVGTKMYRGHDSPDLANKSFHHKKQRVTLP